ncbi:LLM class flavin-dependent oxidoreductase [Falsirhodobacter algicola]|uniref:NtaA/DmoA family FMN-dependent monooxygenase n=1 Tax=Falsirhodobacter algicola TaxID=2692330 RepID=A0A8J8SLC2_9RHOB|nr:LLM class flavin-dependent oxidoreductase [Falsirhodobacter algicola]QUS36358.1 NtaA/DmoA family FMN-dependent monooxygenase [Falsirhodobacter algicola]
MPRQIRLNAFDMACPGHIQQGLWTHPDDQSTRMNDIRYWTEHAQRLERGLFDGIFFADILGVYDVFGGGPGDALRGGVQVPANDPSLIIPAMAAVTRHLGFGVTCNLTYEQPFLFARRMSTLDHLTGGRIGWNIVTGYLDSAARAMGMKGQIAHDDRYDLADEYMQLVYKLWEGSWDDDAVVMDRARGLFADPAKVRAIRHHGPQYSVEAMHLCAPSPQRTPVLYQAGSSDRGRRFAAEHAECIFLNGQKKDDVRAIIADIRARAAANGRSAESVQPFLGATLVIGRTEAEAQEKFAEYRRYVSSDGALVHAAASLGIDLARFDLDEPIETGRGEAIQSNIDIVAKAAGPRWTRRKLLEQMVLGSRQAPWVGSAERIADTLIGWSEETGVAGFNLSRTVSPAGIEDVIDLLIPVLQEKGAYKTSYAEGTYREKLFGHARLPAEHPAARHRGTA